jgi:hypothetical protein
MNFAASPFIALHWSAPRNECAMVTARSRQTVRRRALIWMLDLIDVERILVVDPALRAKVIPSAREGRTVHLLVVLHRIGVGKTIVNAEQRQESYDLDAGKYVALSARRVGGGASLRGGLARGGADEERREDGTTNGVSHAQTGACSTRAGGTEGMARTPRAALVRTRCHPSGPAPIAMSTSSGIPVVIAR